MCGQFFLRGVVTGESVRILFFDDVDVSGEVAGDHVVFECNNHLVSIAAAGGVNNFPIFRHLD